MWRPASERHECRVRVRRGRQQRQRLDLERPQRPGLTRRLLVWPLCRPWRRGPGRRRWWRRRRSRLLCWPSSWGLPLSLLLLLWLLLLRLLEPPLLLPLSLLECWLLRPPLFIMRSQEPLGVMSLEVAIAMARVKGLLEPAGGGERRRSRERQSGSKLRGKQSHTRQPRSICVRRTEAHARQATFHRQSTWASKKLRRWPGLQRLHTLTWFKCLLFGRCLLPLFRPAQPADSGADSDQAA